jgi:hypothetical protein
MFSNHFNTSRTTVFLIVLLVKSKTCHNLKINENLRQSNQEIYNKYNDILDKFKDKYPQVNLSWNRDKIWSQAQLTFNCINPKCKVPVCKLFQYILRILNHNHFILM